MLQKQPPDGGKGREKTPSPVDDLPALAEEQIGRRFTAPLRKRGWLWRGRPLDLFALIVVVLGVQTSFDAAIGAGKLTPSLVLARSAPVFLVGLIVAVIAVCRPEALAGRRPPPRGRGKRS